MPDLRPYTPIACAFHDRLEHHAVRGDLVAVTLAAPDEAPGGERVVRARIADVFARRDDGADADYVRLAPEDGEPFEVRADAVLAVDGVAVGGAC